jgi:hypothetical protein
MSSFLDSLFGGSTPSSFTSTSNSTTTYPQWWQDAQKALILQSGQTAGQPYTPYPGQQVAGFTPAQQQSFDTTQAAAGSYQPGFQAAGQAYANAANPNLNPAALQSYLNPFTSNVVDTIAQLGNRNLTEQVLPQINNTFTGAGQFGSSRNADFTNRAIRDNQQAISNAQGAALSTGYQSSLAAEQAAQQRALQAGVAQQGLGQATQAAGLTGAGALNAIGTQQQNLNQTNLNTAYQNFLQQQQYPYQQENFLKGIISGVNPGSTTTGTQTMPTTNQPGIASQLAGLVTGGIGLGNALGLFGSGASSAGSGLGDIASIVGGGLIGGGAGGFARGGRARLERQFLARGGMPRAPKVAGAVRLPKMKAPSFGGMIGKPMGGFGSLASSGNAVLPPHVPPVSALPGSVTGGSPGAASVLRGFATGSRMPRAA